MVWLGTAGSLLPLLARPQGGTSRSAAGGMSRLPACGWLCRLPDVQVSRFRFFMEEFCSRRCSNGLYEVDPKRGEPRLVEVACWSHARRKVYDVHVETGAPLAKEGHYWVTRELRIKAKNRSFLSLLFSTPPNEFF